MISALLASIVAFSPAGHASVGPQWQADYGKALEATRRTERPLLVVIENQSDEEARLDGKLVSASREVLDDYHLCRVDASTEYGKKVAESFGATKFPHTTIIDKEGSVVLFKKRGKFAKGEWASTLKSYKTGRRSLASTSSRVSREGTIFSPGFGDPNYCPSCQRQSAGF